ELEEECSQWMINLLKERWMLSEDSIFRISRSSMMDFTCFWQIIGSRQFKDKMPAIPDAVPPLSYPDAAAEDIFRVLKHKDILLHHPYNNIEPILELLANAADDPNVMAIKMTIYRLAKDSRITSSLL